MLSLDFVDVVRILFPHKGMTTKGDDQVSNAKDRFHALLKYFSLKRYQSEYQMDKNVNTSSIIDNIDQWSVKQAIEARFCPPPPPNDHILKLLLN